MRGFGAVVAFGVLAVVGSGAPASEPKPEEHPHAPSGHPGEGDAGVPVVQPVAILMDNGDVVPLPVGMGEAMPEDEMMAGDVEAAGGAYGDPYGEYPQTFYGAYPPPPPGAYGFEGADPSQGRHLTQKGYGGYGGAYGAGYGYGRMGYQPAMYGGISPMGPLPGKGWGIRKPGKNFLSKSGKGFMGTSAYGVAVAEAERPIIEQPIYRPPMPTQRPYFPNVAPLYDSRLGYENRLGYANQLPAHITCPTGMKCTAKTYYVPAAAAIRPTYTRPMAPKPIKYLKKSGYGKKYRY